MLSEHADPVAKVTILPAGQALGVTEQLPLVERHLYGEDYLTDSLAVRLGGRAAELVELGQGSTGASNDLASATELATRMVREFGLSPALGPVGYPEGGSVFLGGGGQRAVQPPVRRGHPGHHRPEVARLLREAEQTAVGLIRSHRAELGRIVELLLEKETVDGAEVYRIAAGRCPRTGPVEPMAIAPHAGPVSPRIQPQSRPAPARPGHPARPLTRSTRAPAPDPVPGGRSLRPITSKVGRASPSRFETGARWAAVAGVTRGGWPPACGCGGRRAGAGWVAGPFCCAGLYHRRRRGSGHDRYAAGVTLLVLSAADVHALLTYPDCTEVVAAALMARARGEVHQPQRMFVRPEGEPGLMALMPVVWPGRDTGYALKAICVFPGNPAVGKDAHQGVVLLSSEKTGEPVAIMNASAVTEIRTAAASAVATRALARPDATELAIIGTGVQARSHLRALAETRPLTAIRVAGRTPDRAAVFAAALPEHAGVPVRACASAEAAVAGAGIIVTATSAAEPVLRREWLAPGCHINAVGAYSPRTRELDTATVAAAALFADSRESASNEAGDFLLPLGEGAITPDHLRAELGEVLTGKAAGRTSAAEITVFKSLGLAVEDLAAAVHVARLAAERGAGLPVPF